MTGGRCIHSRVQYICLFRTYSVQGGTLNGPLDLCAEWTRGSFLRLENVAYCWREATSTSTSLALPKDTDPQMLSPLRP